MHNSITKSGKPSVLSLSLTYYAEKGVKLNHFLSNTLQHVLLLLCVKPLKLCYKSTLSDQWLQVFKHLVPVLYF